MKSGRKIARTKNASHSEQTVMRPEVQIVAGNSIEEALTAFRENVNQPGTMFSTEHWLVPKLDQLRGLLTEPITHDEACALLDVLYQRHWMRDLIEWLETRPVTWGNYLTYKAYMAQEEICKRADEHDRRRAAGLNPWGVVKLFPDDIHPKISDTCPDCGSSDWKPIGYGLPTEDTEEDARRGHVVLGGCTLGDASRYCVACFNRWPIKPDMSKPAGRPEWVKRQTVETRSEYARLCALADQPPDPEEPRVERAWARIDGSIEFLVSFDEEKGRVKKTLEYARLGGAPVYSSSFWRSGDYRRTSALAAVAAIRFERDRQPEKHNLYNNWDIVQAHWRKRSGTRDEESDRQRYRKEHREKLSKLLKLARAHSEKLPGVIKIRSIDGEKRFLMQFTWGTVTVQKRQTWFGSFEYHCQGASSKAEDPELACYLACAAAMLAEFPRLARTGARISGRQK